MNAPPQPDIVPVTQEDYETANTWWRQHMSIGPSESLGQLLARYRIAAHNEGKASVELSVQTVSAYEAGWEDGMRRAAEIAQTALGRDRQALRAAIIHAILTKTERGERG